MKKYGALIYKSYNNTFNIGDYIQSLAAIQFLPQVDRYICREELNNYTEEPIKLIMNGWYTHEPNAWPPSTRIDPLFVAFHINSVAKQKLTNKKSIEYYKRHEPIGCRDKNTAEILFTKGVKTYFSGCLTLTLGETFKSDNLGDNIYFVDPYYCKRKDLISLIKFVFLLSKKLTVILRISKKLNKSITLKAIIKTTSFYKLYNRLFTDEVLLKAIFIEHEVSESDFESEIEKFNYAKSLLDKYSKAKYVVTSRIHCALPCLALETPVIYIENNNQTETSFCRLEGLIDLFNVISVNNFNFSTNIQIPKNKIGLDFLFRNKNNFKILRDDLINKCKAFINNGKI
jgi:hypothetical protein